MQWNSEADTLYARLQLSEFYEGVFFLGQKKDENSKKNFLPEGDKNLNEWLLNLAGCKIEESLVFDFIIEASLKAFLESVEEWIHFVSAKKEEIFTE